MERFDLFVIGGGPGGYVAAIEAAHMGKRVALAEERDLGGTCLNRGCIPTKALVHSSELFSTLQHAEDFGLKTEAVSYELSKIFARKDAVVAQLRSGVEKLVEGNRIKLLRGHAVIEAPGRVRVGEEVWETEKILIACGSKPSCPPVPGMDLPGVLTSDELLAEAKDYRSLVIVGGGVIGVELAGVYSALGCQVSIVHSRDRILNTLDKDISQNLSMILKKRGVNILTNARMQGVEMQDGKPACLYSQDGEQKSVAAEAVLVAVGRGPNTDGLCAEGVDLGLQKGYVPVNESYESCLPGIYAIGDAALGSIQLAHYASAQGRNAVHMMFGEEPVQKLENVPSCIYVSPEIASVGLTAAEAEAAGLPVKVGKSMTMANGKSVIAMAERGFAKLVFHAESGVLLGAQLMCERASDMIGGLAAALMNGLTLSQLSQSIWPHPSFSEIIGEAIEDACGGAIHALPRRR